MCILLSESESDGCNLVYDALQVVFVLLMGAVFYVR